MTPSRVTNENGLLDNVLCTTQDKNTVVQFRCRSVPYCIAFTQITKRRAYTKIMDGPRESFYSSIMFFSTAGELLLCVSPRLLFLIRKEQYSSLHLKLHLHHRRTFLNTLVLFLFLKSKNMRRKTSYVAIMILSATDLTVVTIVIQPCFYLSDQSLKFWAHSVVCTAFVLVQ